VAAVELDGDALAVYKANHDHPVIQLDINDWVRVSEALAQFGPFDLVQWSPPCQPHSRANANKRSADPRASVMVAAARLIVRLRAPHCVMENVRGVLEAPEWKAAASILTDAGFGMRPLEVNANDCGVPQRRERVFVVASRTAGENGLDAVAAAATEWATLGPDTVARSAVYGGM
jgi:DNA (cytosine-5)-methyltransferase 1